VPTLAVTEAAAGGTPRAIQRTASFQSALRGSQSVAQGAPRPGVHEITRPVP